MNKGMATLNQERLETNESVHWQISIPPKKYQDDDIPDDITEPDWNPDKTSPRSKQESDWKQTYGPWITKVEKKKAEKVKSNGCCKFKGRKKAGN